MVLVGRFSGFVVLVRDGTEFDLTEKPLHISRVSQFNLGHVCRKDCIMWGFSGVSIPDHKRRRDQDDWECNPAQVRTGVGPGLHVLY